MRRTDGCAEGNSGCHVDMGWPHCGKNMEADAECTVLNYRRIMGVDPVPSVQNVSRCI